MKTLPEKGTPEREATDALALGIGLEALKRTGKVTDALYEVYDYMRVRFIEAGFKHPSRDARFVEQSVSDLWREKLLSAFDR